MVDMDLAIIGAGAAGMSAAIVAARKGLNCKIFESKTPGGRIVLGHVIENYPGFPEGIRGIDLAKKFEAQVKGHGVETVYDDIRQIKKRKGVFVLESEKKEYSASTVIIATGAQHRTLNLREEGRFLGRGISYCVACDGPLFKGKAVAVVGGGNSAASGAMELEPIAKKVYLIHRRDELRADQILGERVKKTKVEILWNTEVKAVHGGKMLESLTLTNRKTKKESELKVDGLFIEVGTVPSSEIARGLGVRVSEKGYVVTDARQHTNIEGVLAAGDVCGRELQISVAVGDGCVAATSAYHYLRGIGKVKAAYGW